jgi:putative flippase GtrA
MDASLRSSGLLRVQIVRPNDAVSRSGNLLAVVRRQRHRLFPFLVTGVANSIVGYSTIFFCLFMGASGITANITGFAIALTCSFLLNRNYVFGVNGAVSHTEVVKFMCVFLASYGVNVAVLLLIQPYFGEASGAAQVIAIAAYTVVFYPLSRIFVFTSGGSQATKN